MSGKRKKPNKPVTLADVRMMQKRAVEMKADARAVGASSFSYIWTAIDAVERLGPLANRYLSHQARKTRERAKMRLQAKAAP